MQSIDDMIDALTVNLVEIAWFITGFLVTVAIGALITNIDQ